MDMTSNKQRKFKEKWHTLIDQNVRNGYNNTAYVIKRIVQRNLLEGTSLTNPRHQDVDTS